MFWLGTDAAIARDDDSFNLMSREHRNMAGVRPLHLAFPVHDLAAARAFYGDLLGCPEGRSSDEWIDFDLYGHQIVAHIHPGARPYGSGPAAS
jgi:hypothetical protein